MMPNSKQPSTITFSITKVPGMQRALRRYAKSKGLSVSAAIRNVLKGTLTRSGHLQ
jgi:hypothetical protein